MSNWIREQLLALQYPDLQRFNDQIKVASVSSCKMAHRSYIRAWYYNDEGESKAGSEQRDREEKLSKPYRESDRSSSIMNLP